MLLFVNVILTCLKQQGSPPAEIFHQYIRDWREQERTDTGTAHGDTRGQRSPSLEVKSGSYHSWHVYQSRSDAT